MSNSQQAYAVLQRVAAEPKTSIKQSILTEAKDNHVLKMVLQWAYDPFKNYGIKHVAARAAGVEPGELDFTHESVTNVLFGLNGRVVTGNEARDTVDAFVANLNAHSSELFRFVIHKDVRAGFGAKTVNKVWPALIPETPYMRCSLPDASKPQEWDYEIGAILQVKMDGMFVNTTRVGDQVTFHSRSGEVFPHGCFPEIEAFVLKNFDTHTQTHGELLVYKDGEMLSRKVGNGMLNSLAQGGSLEPGHTVRLTVWDQIGVDHVLAKICNTPYLARYDRLRHQVDCIPEEGTTNAVTMVESYVVRSYDEAQTIFKSFLRRKLEGGILKKMTAIWKSGTSLEQTKLKLEATAEFEITGFTEGAKGKKTEKTFGAISYKSADGRITGNVSGITDKLRNAMHADREAYIGKIIGITFNDLVEVTDEPGNYSLINPRFDEIREDKTTADTTDHVVAVFKSSQMVE